MPEWIQQILGPGGALIVLAVVAREGYKFFKEMLEKQELKSERREVRFDELHAKTLDHIGASAEAMRDLTYSIKKRL